MQISFALRERVGFQYLLDAMNPASPYGAERVRRPAFFAPGEENALLRAWQNVRAALDGLATHPSAYGRLSRLMMQLRDLRGTIARCRDTVLTEVELFEVKRFLLQLGQIAPLFAQIGGGYQAIVVTELPDALSLLDPDGQRAAGFQVSNAYAKPLAAVREEKRRLELALRETPEGSARETLLAERRLLIAREEAETLRVRQMLSEGLRPYLDAMLENMAALGELDYTIEKAGLAKRFAMTEPTLTPRTQGLCFAGMRNPQVVETLQAREQAFTPVSLSAPVGATVITGANMGGKSVALRTLVLNVLLCQAGFFACATRAQMQLFDGIEVVMEDLDDTRAGLSSFGAEVVRLDGILQTVRQGAYACVVLDEPARGTNPREGAALVAALAQCFAGLDAVTVLATHYDGIAPHAQAHYQAAGLRALDTLPEGLSRADRLENIAAHMDYGLIPVPPDAGTPQEALKVCRLLGMDADVVAIMQAELSATAKDAENA